MKTELLVIEQSGFELEPFFTKGTGIDEILNKLETEIMAHVPDVSTVKSRGEITANISKAKVYRLHLFDCRKKLSAEYKLIPSTIDKHGKKVNDFLLNIEAKARTQLTEWEVEDKSKKEHAALLVKIDQKHDEAKIANELFDLKAKQEEADRQAEIKAASDKAAAEAKEQAEAEAAERIAQAEREKIAAEQREIAANQAVIDAENKAAQDAIDAASREAKAKQDIIDAKAQAEKSERERVAAEEVRKEEMRVDYHKRMVQHIVDCGNGFIGGSPQSFGILFYELENKIVIDEKFEEFQQEAEAERNESIQKLKNCQEKQAKDREDAEAKSIRDNEIAAENARKCEVRKQEVAAHQAKVDQAAREADLDNKMAKNNAAKDAIMALGFNEEGAKSIIKAIAKGLIPAVTIRY